MSGIQSDVASIARRVENTSAMIQRVAALNGQTGRHNARTLDPTNQPARIRTPKKSAPRYSSDNRYR